MTDVPPQPDALAAVPATPRPLAALGGAIAVMAALAVGELAAGLIPGIPSAILAIGRVVIALQPPGAKEFAVALFGTADKFALEILIVGVALAIGAGLGIVAMNRPGLAAAVLAAFAGLGFIASLGEPGAEMALAATAAAGSALVGIRVLGYLVPRGVTTRNTTTLGTMPEWSRRAILIRGGIIATTSVVAAAVGRNLLGGQRQAPTGDLPTPGVPAELPDGAELAIEGLTPIVVPNPDFYRIDTALITPNVDPATWRLRIHGLVDREVSLSLEELSALPVIEQYVTIACVSNKVGGGLIGNALWTGVDLRDVLAIAGPRSDATQLVGRSVDDFTAGMPMSWVMDPARVPMIALGMNGEPLPRDHGYPARLIIPGLYGYVSATKWLAELELTTWEAFDGYWIPLGWAKEAPILTQSRIDTPRAGRRLDAGPQVIAGVAWAPDRGISRVEVAIDGAWRDATRSVPISDATWVQWMVDWDATPGRHAIEVRATDGDGVAQTADRTAPAPDGARGHHTIEVEVD